MAPTFLRITFALTLLALLSACQTTVTKDGITLSDEEVAAMDQPKKTVNVMDERIKASLDGLDFRRGSGLLRDIQFLVETKELAVPHILERLPDSSARTRASLLYVLGFARNRRSGETLVSYLEDDDSVVRYEAAAGLLNHGEMSAIPVLISFLDSDSKAFRYKAMQALRIGTGKEFGYEFSAPQSERQAAVARWSSWWAKEKSRLMARRSS